MKEIHDIVEAYDTARRQAKQAVLATVVRVEGSSYRRPGARMLVTDDGQITGAISGGCLEGDALNRALLAAYQKENKLITYDTTKDSDAAFGVQLGCNGIVHILFEYIDAEQDYNPIALLRELIQYRSHAVIAVQYALEQRDRQRGTFLLVKEDSGTQKSFASVASSISYNLQQDINQVLENKRSHQTAIIEEGVSQDILLEHIAPTIALFIFGAGNDAQPLVELATILNWPVTVIDGRATHATARRFPKAKRVLIAPASEAIAQLSIDSYSVAVLMTHNYNYDRDVLRQLIQSDSPYIGLLGPKKRFDRLITELNEHGNRPDLSDMTRLFGPIGLDIGSETSEEIALSILSEIKAVMSNRDGRSLRERTTKMHGNTPVLTGHVC